jgi:hypothetical protein
MRVALACLLVAVSPGAASADDPEASDARTEHPGADAERTDDDPPASAGTADVPMDEPIERDEHRGVPNYDGRPEPGPDGVDIALWIPRIIFSPVYLVAEYVIRRPLDWMFTELERIHAFTWLLDLFTFGPNHEAGILPTAFWDFGFRPSIGLYGYWNGFLSRHNRIQISAATGGPDWWLFNVSDTFVPSSFTLFRVNFNAIERPDQIFGGIGWNATQNVRSRYLLKQLDASIVAGIRPWRRTAVDYELGFRTASFAPNAIFNDPGVGERGQVPPGFTTGYNAVRAGVSAVIDTHELQELATGGIIGRAFVTHNAGFGGLPTLSRWLTWGGTLMLSTDFLGHGRVLSIRGDTSFITIFDEDNPQVVVPFTELIDAGGNGPLRAFWPGWIRGYSMAALSLIYVWPVWAFLDAHLRVTVGNAFGQYLQDFQFDRLRMSFDVGMEPRFGGQHPFELLFGVGTQTFSAGTEVTTIRIAIGTRTGI